MKRIQALYKYSLPSTEGTPVSFGQLLKDTNGLIILSFPLAFMDESEHHLTWFRDHHETLQNHNIRIVGLGIDSIFALKSFREKLQLPFHLLSDANRKVSRCLDILLPEVEGIEQVPSLSVVYFDRLRHIRRWGNGLNHPDYARIVDGLQRQEVAAHG